MLNQFTRTQLVLGPDAMEALGRARVAVFGIGGVGGFAVEALARSGVGSLDLIDDDLVCTSNLNRQIIATFSAIGQYKVDVMQRRIADINPQCNVVTHKCFYLPDTADRFDFSQYDYVVDAVDTVTAKLQLIDRAHATGTPIICSMGAANKIDPTAFEVADIYDTSICPLAKIIRKECRKRGVKSLKVVYSKEPARQLYRDAPAADTITCSETETIGCRNDSPDDNGQHPVRRSGIPGSVAFVPSVAGLILAAEVVKDLTSGAPEPLE